MSLTNDMITASTKAFTHITKKGLHMIDTKEITQTHHTAGIVAIPRRQFATQYAALDYTLEKYAIMNSGVGTMPTRMCLGAKLNPIFPQKYVKKNNGNMSIMAADRMVPEAIVFYNGRAIREECGVHEKFTDGDMFSEEKLIRMAQRTNEKIINAGDKLISFNAGLMSNLSTDFTEATALVDWFFEKFMPDNCVKRDWVLMFYGTPEMYLNLGMRSVAEEDEMKKYKFYYGKPYDTDNELFGMCERVRVLPLYHESNELYVAGDKFVKDVNKYETDGNKIVKDILIGGAYKDWTIEIKGKDADNVVPIPGGFLPDQAVRCLLQNFMATHRISYIERNHRSHPYLRSRLDAIKNRQLGIKNGDKLLCETEESELTTAERVEQYLGLYTRRAWNPVTSSMYREDEEDARNEFPVDKDAGVNTSCWAFNQRAVVKKSFKKTLRSEATEEEKLDHAISVGLGDCQANLLMLLDTHSVLNANEYINKNDVVTGVTEAAKLYKMRVNNGKLFTGFSPIEQMLMALYGDVPRLQAEVVHAMKRAVETSTEEQKLVAYKKHPECESGVDEKCPYCEDAFYVEPGKGCLCYDTIKGVGSMKMTNLPCNSKPLWDGMMSRNEDEFVSTERLTEDQIKNKAFTVTCRLYVDNNRCSMGPFGEASIEDRDRPNGFMKESDIVKEDKDAKKKKNNRRIAKLDRLYNRVKKNVRLIPNQYRKESGDDTAHILSEVDGDNLNMGVSMEEYILDKICSDETITKQRKVEALFKEDKPFTVYPLVKKRTVEESDDEEGDDSSDDEEGPTEMDASILFTPGIKRKREDEPKAPAVKKARSEDELELISDAARAILVFLVKNTNNLSVKGKTLNSKYQQIFEKPPADAKLQIPIKLFAVVAHILKIVSSDPHKDSIKEQFVKDFISWCGDYYSNVEKEVQKELNYESVEALRRAVATSIVQAPNGIFGGEKKCSKNVLDAYLDPFSCSGLVSRMCTLGAIELFMGSYAYINNDQNKTTLDALQLSSNNGPEVSSINNAKVFVSTLKRGSDGFATQAVAVNKPTEAGASAYMGAIHALAPTRLKDTLNLLMFDTGFAKKGSKESLNTVKELNDEVKTVRHAGMLSEGFKPVEIMGEKSVKSVARLGEEFLTAGVFTKCLDKDLIAVEDKSILMNDLKACLEDTSSDFKTTFLKSFNKEVETIALKETKLVNESLRELINQLVTVKKINKLTPYHFLMYKSLKKDGEKMDLFFEPRSLRVKMTKNGNIDVDKLTTQEAAIFSGCILTNYLYGTHQHAVAKMSDFAMERESSIAAAALGSALKVFISDNQVDMNWDERVKQEEVARFKRKKAVLSVAWENSPKSKECAVVRTTGWPKSAGTSLAVVGMQTVHYKEVFKMQISNNPPVRGSAYNLMDRPLTHNNVVLFRHDLGKKGVVYKKAYQHDIKNSLTDVEQLKSDLNNNVASVDELLEYLSGVNVVEKTESGSFVYNGEDLTKDIMDSVFTWHRNDEVVIEMCRREVVEAHLNIELGIKEDGEEDMDCEDIDDLYDELDNIDI